MKLTSDGVLSPPVGIVGWYAETGWPRPGVESVQRSVLAGHDANKGKPDTFYDLPKARAGDTVRVHYDSGDVATFAITADPVSVDKGSAVDVATHRWVWFAPGDRAEQVVSLITCDLAAEHVDGHSVSNIIVQARRTG